MLRHLIQKAIHAHKKRQLKRMRSKECQTDDELAGGGHALEGGGLLLPEPAQELSLSRFCSSLVPLI